MDHVAGAESLATSITTAGALRLRVGAQVACLFLLACCGCSVPPDCATFQSVSVRELRSDFWSGCFELRHVVVVARTGSSSAPRVYVQDPRGGQLSAIVAKCSGASAHACSALTSARVLQLLNGADVTVRGSYHRDMQNGFEELYLDEVVDHGTLLDIPAPATLTVAQLARSARVRGKWFQVAAVDASETTDANGLTISNFRLTMYDLSPTEFRLGGPACPHWSGFGMIPLQAVSRPVGVEAFVASACDTGMTPYANPPSVELPDPREILIGRRFFDSFSWSTDCACADATHLLSESTSTDGPMVGVLGLEVNPSTGEGYQVFDPLSKAQFPKR